MENKTFILKENSHEIREKIRKAGIDVCICASFDGAVLLDFSTVVGNGVHGVGYGGGEMTDEEALSLFYHEVRNPVYCNDVDEFIWKIKEWYASKESGETT